MIFKYIILFVILTAILSYMYGWVAQSEREIAEEEAEEKYNKIIEDWKQTAQHPRVQIKVICGGESEFVIENRR